MKQGVSPAVAVIVIVIVVLLVALAIWKFTGSKDEPVGKEEIFGSKGDPMEQYRKQPPPNKGGGGDVDPASKMMRGKGVIK